jgi:hypothetical protein
MNLSALPAWCQQDVILPDGDYDPQRFNDCGETCVAEVVACVKGTPISPASVRANLGGPDRSGITNAQALVDALAFYGVKAHSESPDASQIQRVITHYTLLAQPTIVLGVWATPGSALHWMLTTGHEGTWQYNNPWNGHRSYLPWADMVNQYAKSIVVVDAQLHYDMSKESQPY